MNSTKRILVVEDEKALCVALEKKLMCNGFDVISASDGEEGLSLALKQRPDLILLDVVLPVMDGLTVLEKIKKDDWGKTVPMIILSNLDRVDVTKKGEEKSVHTVLVKTKWKLNDIVGKVKQELHIV